MLLKLYRRLLLIIVQTPIWFILIRLLAKPRPSADSKKFVEFLRKIQYGDIILSDSRCNLTHLLVLNDHYIHAGIVTNSGIAEIRAGRKIFTKILDFWKDSHYLAIIRLRTPSPQYLNTLCDRAIMISRDHSLNRMFSSTEFCSYCDIDNKIRPKRRNLDYVSAQAIYDGSGIEVVWEQN